MSRKLSGAPSWAVPGLTRVFLAHRGDQRRSHRGRVFGYFVLHRVERLTAASAVQVPHDEVRAQGLDSRDNGMLDAVVLSSQTGKGVSSASLTLTAKGSLFALPMEFEAGSDGRCRAEVEAGEYDVEVSAEGFEAREFRGVTINRGRTRKQDLNLQPSVPQPVREPMVKERTKECPDGEIIVTHVWEDGRWVRTDEKCDPVTEPEECIDGEIRLAVCPDGSAVVSHMCINGEWHDTGAECPRDMPVEDEPPEERSCSLRLRPGSVYLVDSLAAQIHDAYAASLAGDAHDALPPTLVDTSLKRDYARAVGDAARAAAIAKGRAHFNAVVDSVLEHRRMGGGGPFIPPELEGKVEIRGDLVLFKEPPILDRRPRPSTRSLLQVSGDRLIDDIASGASRVAVPTCLRASQGKSVTKGEIVAQLSAKSNVNKATVKLLLESLAKLAAEELGKRGEEAFRLPGFGTFRWKRLRGQPHRVVFHMAKAMKDLKHPRE